MIFGRLKISIYLALNLISHKTAIKFDEKMRLEREKMEKPTAYCVFKLQGGKQVESKHYFQEKPDL